MEMRSAKASILSVGKVSRIQRVALYCITTKYDIYVLVGTLARN